MFSFTIRGKVYQAATLAGISAAYCKARDESGEGASTFPAPFIKVNGADVLRLSYNGRIWFLDRWNEQAKPLYDPAADPVPVMLAALHAVNNDAYKDDDGDFLLYRQSNAEGKEIGPPLAIVAVRKAIAAAEFATN